MDHYSTIADRRRLAPIDSALQLRDRAAAAISATTSETGLAFDATKIEAYKILINHSDISAVVATTAEWQIAVQASTTLGGTYSTVGGAISLGATASIRVVSLTGKEVNDVVPGAKFLRVTATKVGTPGNLTYGAWIGLT